jgi:predicted Ser/Thr protein kinase
MAQVRYPLAVDSSDDELARTATAAPTAPARPGGSPVGRTLGRYKLERELGAGGMGVVHAAFDPDLERRVAIKVLRAEHGDEASKRLLREARAMARLTHANVITVHEVGSASGRDFIAMELVDGTTLAEWLRATPRKPAEVIDAFLAAGRGLAAAHAAGIVHRDFKPHNVLCGTKGRIVVTDFGLAREAEPAAIHDPLAVTMPVGAVAATETGQSTPLSGLTVEGSVLGTPAYMAPEQWTGGTVTPATDQFAYCVALWEALSGERPYKGPTVEDLKTQVARGPHALDASKIPRPLRSTLRRGLDPDPARRWPSMDALLAKIKRAELRPGVAVAIGSVALAGAIFAVMVLHPEEPPAAIPCAAPALAPDDFAARLGDLRAGTPEVAKVFDDELARWKTARDAACTSDAGVRHTKLRCLDAVMARLDAVRRASLVPPKPVLVGEIAIAAVDPALCLRTDPPALAATYSDAAVTGLALRRLDSEDPYDEVTDAAATKAAANDPCARFQLALARGMSPKAARARQSVDEAIALADQCRDDRAKAEAALLDLYYQTGVFSEQKLVELTRRTELVVARVDQTELRARFDELAGKAALVGGNYDVALAKLDAAITGLTRMPHHQLEAASDRIEILVARNLPADVVRARAEIAKWRPVAQALNEPELDVKLERLAATLAWFAGDQEAAHRRMLALEASNPGEPAGTRRVTGVVVDQTGKPVAGASVVGGAIIVVDSFGIGLPLGAARVLVRAKTDARGAFTLEGLAETGAIAAESERERSTPVPIADKVRLVLGPVGTVRGRVDLAGVRPHEVFVVAVSGARGTSPMYQHLAPVSPDGRFTLDRVLRGKLRVGAAIRNSKGEAFALRDLVVGAQPVDDVVIVPPSRRALSVLVRSTSSAPLDGAIAFVLPGKLGPQNLRDLKTLFAASQVAMTTANPIGGEPPAAVASKHLRGDLLATFANAPLGNGIMCAVGLQGDLSDPAFNELLGKAMDKLDVRCAPLRADATVGVLEIPPMKRLDPAPAKRSE